MKPSKMSEKIVPVLTLKSELLLLKESVVKSKHSCTTSDFDLDDDCVNIFQNGFWSTVESKNQNHLLTPLQQKSQSPVTSDLGDSNRGSSPEEESIITKQSPDHISKKDDAIIPKEATTENVALSNPAIKIEKSEKLPKQGG
jgi:hypothetical protein